VQYSTGIELNNERVRAGFDFLDVSFVFSLGQNNLMTLVRSSNDSVDSSGTSKRSLRRERLAVSFIEYTLN
jgi:hypothetical protein